MYVRCPSIGNIQSTNDLLWGVSRSRVLSIECRVEGVMLDVAIDCCSSSCLSRSHRPQQQPGSTLAVFHQNHVLTQCLGLEDYLYQVISSLLSGIWYYIPVLEIRDHDKY